MKESYLCFTGDHTAPIEIKKALHNRELGCVKLGFYVGSVIRSIVFISHDSH